MLRLQPYVPEGVTGVSSAPAVDGPRLTVKSTLVPESTVVFAGTVCEITIPAITVSEFASLTVDHESPEAVSAVFAAVSERPTILGTVTCSVDAPVLTTTVTVLSFATISFADGVCDITFPFATVSLAAVCDVI